MHLFTATDAQRFTVTDADHSLFGAVVARFDGRRDLFAPVCADTSGVFLDHDHAAHVWADQLEELR